MKKSSSGNYTIYESTDPCELHKYSETLAKELEKKDNEIEKSLKESVDNINELEEENILNQENITEIIDLLPKVSNEGESITLENTARAKFTKFRIGGNSSQETRSGKNKIIFNDIKETVNQGITCSIKNGVITLNGTASGVVNFYSNPINISAGKYTLSKNMEGTWSLGTATSSLAILLQQKEKDGSYTTVKGGELTAYSSAGTYRIRVFIATGNILNNFTWRPQLEEGENFTGFEQGGLMPSVEFPSEIRNVGDNGNLYNKDNPNILDTPIDTSGLGGNVKNTYKTVWIPCKPNTTYTVSKKYDATKNRFALAYTSEEPNYSQQVEGYASNAYTNVMTITTNSTAKYLIAYVWITGGSNTYQEMLDSIKIERGVQATADSGYGCGNLEIIISNENLGNNESHIVFPFVQGQKLMQGDYLADDGIHHKRKQVVLDGSDDEGWGYNGGSLSNNISAFTANISNLISVENTDTKVRVMCNKTIGLSASEATKLQKYNAIAVIQDKRIYLCVQRSSFSTSPSTLKTWLQSNPITVEYELAEEEIETYTEVQKEAYEQIKNAISYKGQTNIFSTNEIKPIFKVEALADIGLLLNNMQAQILAGGE